MHKSKIKPLTKYSRLVANLLLKKKKWSEIKLMLNVSFHLFQMRFKFWLSWYESQIIDFTRPNLYFCWLPFFLSSSL